VIGLDMAFAELGREAFEQLDLLVREGDLALGGLLLQPEQSFMLGEQVVVLPDAAHAARRDGEAFSLSSCSTLSAPWQG
jgi:hypothetical protein